MGASAALKSPEEPAPESSAFFTQLTSPLLLMLHFHSVERDCKLSELSAALVEKLQSMGGSAALKPSEELLFAAQQDDCHDPPNFMRDLNQKMGDSLLSNRERKLTLLAFK